MKREFRGNSGMVYATQYFYETIDNIIIMRRCDLSSSENKFRRTVSYFGHAYCAVDTSTWTMLTPGSVTEWDWKTLCGIAYRRKKSGVDNEERI